MSDGNTVVMAVDLGTTNCKAAVFDVEGKPLAISRSEYTSERRPLVPDDWLYATVSNIEAALKWSKVNPHEVSGLGFSTRAGDLMAFLDYDDRPIQPKVDFEEVASIREELEAKLFPQHLEELLGNVGIVPWVIWMQRKNRNDFEKISKIMGYKDYVIYKLTGVFAADVLDKEAGRRAVTFCENEHIIEPVTPKLPPLYPPTTIIGTLKPEWASRFGFKSSMPVVVGGRDGTCATTGVGATRIGQACSTIASSVCIRVISDRPLIDFPKNRIDNRIHSIPGLWLVDNTPGGGTVCLRWFRDELGQIENQVAGLTHGNPYFYYDEEANLTPPGADGLIFIPSMAGMNVPVKNRKARGVLFGLRQEHTKGHIIRAILEGIIFANLSGARIIENMGGRFDEIRTTGGGTRSPVWNQIQADIMNKPVVTSSVEEPECLGVSIFISVALGIYPTIADAIKVMVRTKDVYQPRPQYRDVYERQFKLYESLCFGLEDVFKKL
ncbi:MAG: FGGY-family carbohydrate kinase [Candidatus Bathyarchaeia archaeon]